MAQELNELGRYAGPATLVLSSLADGPKHGYALIKDIEEFAGVVLGPGTLYGALARLEDQGPDRGRRARGSAAALPADRRRAGSALRVHSSTASAASPTSAFAACRSPAARDAGTSRIGGDRVRRRVARLVRWYPRSWRERYGDELADVLEQSIAERPRSLRRAADVAPGAG